MAEGLEAGIIGINDPVPATPQCPFGGMKESGLGRELGHEGLEAYLETKYVSFKLRRLSEAGDEHRGYPHGASAAAMKESTGVIIQLEPVLVASLENGRRRFRDESSAKAELILGKERS